jgi:hypothetical protein
MNITMDFLVSIFEVICLGTVHKLRHVNFGDPPYRHGIVRFFFRKHCTVRHARVTPSPLKSVT